MQSVVVEICWRPAPSEGAEVFHEVVDLDDGRVAVLVGQVRGGAEAAEVSCASALVDPAACAVWAADAGQPSRPTLVR